MNVDKLPNSVWIGTMYVGDARVERVVHLTEADARHDIETLAETYDGDDASTTYVEKERLLTGRVDDTENYDATPRQRRV